MFKTRNLKPERIDTGDYTADEYAVFLREIAFINKYLGDSRALKKTLLREIEHLDLHDFSVLDVGAGSGELLRLIAKFAADSSRNAWLTGIDLNEISTAVMQSASKDFPAIAPVRANALKLPFADGSFDYAISSLFFHHLTDEQIVEALKEMTRVARRGIYVIDLHRHPMAYVLYKLFCIAFRISPLVRHDGALSILKGFKPADLSDLLKASNLPLKKIDRVVPFRIVVSGKGNNAQVQQRRPLLGHRTMQGRNGPPSAATACSALNDASIISRLGDSPRSARLAMPVPNTLSHCQTARQLGHQV